MATEIILSIADDGTMTVRTETAEVESAENEMVVAEETQGEPVQDIEQALEVIRQMADQTSMSVPQQGMDSIDETDTAPLTSPAAEEEAAMMGAFKGR